jgi:hypothetical protein
VGSLARERRKGKGLVRRTILILATMVVMLVVVGGVALARADCQWSSSTGWNCFCHPGVFCEGRNDPVDRDLIWGSNSGDRIFAYAGDDEIYAEYGSDRQVVGGDGDDLIDGGPGYDRCDGGNGYDLASGCEFTVRVEGPWE